MPIYEYHCDECKDRFEKLVRSTTKVEEIECPACGSKKLRKALSCFGVGGAKSGSPASAESSCGST